MPNPAAREERARPSIPTKDHRLYVSSLSDHLPACGNSYVLEWGHNKCFKAMLIMIRRKHRRHGFWRAQSWLPIALLPSYQVPARLGEQAIGTGIVMHHTLL